MRTVFSVTTHADHQESLDDTIQSQQNRIECTAVRRVIDFCNLGVCNGIVGRNSQPPHFLLPSPSQDTCAQNNSVVDELCAARDTLQDLDRNAVANFIFYRLECREERNKN